VPPAVLDTLSLSYPLSMMTGMRYYVNKNSQSNGDHEVHTGSCTFLPLEQNRLYLGDFSSCRPAVTEAKKHYSSSNGCYYCSPVCNVG
jgi:hypothetical protein